MNGDEMVWALRFMGQDSEMESSGGKRMKARKGVYGGDTRRVERRAWIPANGVTGTLIYSFRGGYPLLQGFKLDPRWGNKYGTYWDYFPKGKSFVIKNYNGKAARVPEDNVKLIAGEEFTPVESDEFWPLEERERGEGSVKRGEERRTAEGIPDARMDGSLHDYAGTMGFGGSNDPFDYLDRFDNLTEEDYKRIASRNAIGPGSGESGALVLHPHNDDPRMYIMFSQAPEYGYSMIGAMNPLYSVLGRNDLAWDETRGLGVGKGNSRYHDMFRKLWPGRDGDSSEISRLIAEDFLSSPMFEGMTDADKKLFFDMAQARQAAGQFLTWNDIKELLKGRHNDPGEAGYIDHIASYIPTPNMKIPERLVYDKLVESIFRQAKAYTDPSRGGELGRYPENLKLVVVHFPLKDLVGNEAVGKGRVSSARKNGSHLVAGSYKVGDVISDAERILGKNSPVKDYYDRIRSGAGGKEAFMDAFSIKEGEPPVSDAEMKSIAGGIMRGIEPLLKQRSVTAGILRGTV